MIKLHVLNSIVLLLSGCLCSLSSEATDLLGIWQGCDGRKVEFTQEGDAFVGRYIALGNLGAYKFQVGEVGYRHRLLDSQAQTYQGQDKWRRSDPESTFYWRDSVIRMSADADSFSDSGADQCSATMARVHPPEVKDFEVVLRIDASLAHFSAELQPGFVCPNDRVHGCSQNVTCDNMALDFAGDALDFNQMKWAAWKSVTTVFKLGKPFASFLGLSQAADVADVILKYYESESAQEFASKMAQFGAGKAASAEAAARGWDYLERRVASQVASALVNAALPSGGSKDYWDATYNHSGCGSLYVVSSMRMVEDRRSMRMTFGAMGDCEGKFPLTPGPRLMAWRVLGGINLTPVRSETEGDRITIVYSYDGRANYEVAAACTRS
jgi:hypothetical protein